MDSDGPQSVIDADLVDTSDIVIALFWTTIGSPVPNAKSGTIKEIERAEAHGKPVHVFFKESPYPSNVDPEKLMKLREFKQELSSKALFGTFSDINDLTIKIHHVLTADSDLFESPEQLVDSTPVNTSGGNLGGLQVGGTVENTTIGQQELPTTISSARGNVFGAVFRRTGELGRLQITNRSADDLIGVRVILEPLEKGVAPTLLEQSLTRPLLSITTWTIEVHAPARSTNRLQVKIRGTSPDGADVTETLELEPEI